MHLSHWLHHVEGELAGPRTHRKAIVCHPRVLNVFRFALNRSSPYPTFFTQTLSPVVLPLRPYHEHASIHVALQLCSFLSQHMSLCIKGLVLNIGGFYSPTGPNSGSMVAFTPAFVPLFLSPFRSLPPSWSTLPWRFSQTRWRVRYNSIYVSSLTRNPHRTLSLREKCA